MIRCLVQFSLVFLMCMITFGADGQSSRLSGSAAKKKYFQIPGRVKLEKGNPSGAVVRLIDLDSKQIEKSVDISSSGKFDLDLSFFKEYKLSITKEGYYDKDINISTVIPRDVWEKDSVFPPYAIVVVLYKKVDGVKLSFEGKPIGKVFYSPNGSLDNFDSNILINDQSIEEEIYNALKSLDDKDFNLKMAEALESEKKSDLVTARKLYSEASKIKPSDKFAKEKIKELASDINDLGNEAKILAEFNSLMALGDANVSSFKYNEAIQYFKGALKIKPANPVAVKKLSEAEKQLALAGEKAKKDVEFNRLIAKGDANVNQSKLAEAIIDFKDALNVRVGDSIALARIADAEKQLALLGDKAKKDAEFQRLIAAGDANVNQSKFTEAIINFKNALNVRAGDSIALARIADAEKQIALLGDKAKKEAEFNRLIAAGDANVNQSKYAEAISSFKEALNIRPGDSIALVRISTAEKQMAIAGDKAKKDADYNRLIAAGDANVSQLKYTEAISSFKEALNIRPGDSIALARISTAEKQMAIAGDKAKKDAEFNRLIAAGDANVSQSKFAEAIINFKDALNVRTGDSIALARIADAEKQLALLGDKAKKDAEFNRLIASGDANVNQTKYTEAISNFKSALSIKPDDQSAKIKLSAAEQLQAKLLADNASKEEEFNRLVLKGDDNVNGKNYNDAISNYNDALKIKPVNSEVVIKRNNATRLLALLNETQNKLDQEFNRLLSAGDASVSTKKYIEAIASYKSALKLKSNAVVNAKIVETERLMQITEAERIRLDAEKQTIALKQQQYKEAIQKADQLFASKSFPESKKLYQQALAVDQTSTYPVERIREIDKIVVQLQSEALLREQENVKMKLYNDAVVVADESYKAKNWSLALANYAKASDIRTNEVYPKNKIQEINNFIAQDKASSKLFNDAMDRAAANYKDKKYNEAILAYGEAQKIKTSETLPSQKIKEIQLIIDALATKMLDDQKSLTDKKLSKDEKQYLEKIKIADENYKKSQWSVARFYYIEALNFKVGDTYSLDKVDSCDKMIDSGITAEKMQDYKNKIDKANEEMKVKNFSSARFYYRSAIDILNWENYPHQQLQEIDKIVSEKLNESDKRLFAESQNMADEAFDHKEYPVARFYYNKAIEISQSDHVASRLKEIEAIVNGSEAKKMQASYVELIKKGDEAVKQKNNSIARFYFQKAIALMPNEKYPKEELKKIDLGSVNP